MKFNMNIFCKRADGGKDSGVTAYFLIEWKAVISIAILHFREGSREGFHSHAFNALTWWIRGAVIESKPDGYSKNYYPSFIPKYTPRENCHKVTALQDTYALTIRGPWVNKWYEIKNGNKIWLTHGRKEYNENNKNS